MKPMTEERKRRRALERTFPKCACGATIGKVRVDLGFNNCSRCQTTADHVENDIRQLSACIDCGEIHEETNGHCPACQSEHTGEVRVVMRALVARVRVLADKLDEF